MTMRRPADQWSRTRTSRRRRSRPIGNGARASALGPDPERIGTDRLQRLISAADDGAAQRRSKEAEACGGDSPHRGRRTFIVGADLVVPRAGIGPQASA